MSGKRGGSRDRMLDSAVELLRERGTAGLSVDAVLARSGAPRGSVYHHFPGGRNELMLTAVRRAGDYITRAIDRAAETGDPEVLLDSFARFWVRSLRESDYRAGCPVLAMAVDGREDPPEAAALVQDIFTAWQDRFTALLERAGFEPARAHRLATLAISSIEGAVTLCRVHRDTAPLEAVVAELRPLLTL